VAAMLNATHAQQDGKTVEEKALQIM